MNFDDLKDPELQEKLKAAKRPEDILAIAKEVGFELADDQLEAVSGGKEWYEPRCPQAGNCPNWGYEGG